MERFQLVNHFSYPWPVNVSYVGGSEFSYLVGYIMYVLTFCSTITEIVVSFCIMTSAAIICLTFLEIRHIFTNVARELRKLTPVKCFSLGKPGQNVTEVSLAHHDVNVYVCMKYYPLAESLLGWTLKKLVPTIPLFAFPHFCSFGFYVLVGFKNCLVDHVHIRV